MAMTYDAFLILAILFCITMVYAFVVVAISSDISSDISQVQNNDILRDLEPIPLGWPYYILAFSTYLGFYCYFWRKTGQTLGMQAWKIKLYSNNEKNISYQQCLIRILIGSLSLGLLGLGYLTLLLNRENGCWHDRASNTVVVDLRNNN
jgi:uncharacterized RDD family membrane protein YckC